jgi:hemophore-related protein
MIKLSLTGLVTAVGGLAVSLAAGAGVASATPDLEPAINTTCTYPQLMEALNAQGPQVTMVLDQQPVLKAGLAQFIAAGPAQRRQTAQEIVNTPGSGPYIGPLQQAFSTCNNY